MKNQPNDDIFIMKFPKKQTLMSEEEKVKTQVKTGAFN
jgi:hypothetical protein